MSGRAHNPPSSERDIQNAIRLHLGSRADLRLFRNNVGEAWQGQARRVGDAVLIDQPRRVNFGLHPGSPDLVGLRRITVTPEMVGQTLAVFVGLEVKATRGRLRPAQQQFLDMLAAFGATQGVARSPAEAEAVVYGAGSATGGVHGR